MLQGHSISAIARKFKRSRPWVHKWIRRYRDGGKEWFLDRSTRPHRTARHVSNPFERLVIRTHARLKSQRNPLGFYGAEAIYNELVDLGIQPLHSIRTIHRILVRHRLLTRKHRDRSRKGPVLPFPTVRRQNDLHQFDFIVGHYLSSHRPVVVLSRKDLATGMVYGTEEPDRRVQHVLVYLERDWRHHGIPRFLQMDNDMSLTGGRIHPRSLGQLIRFCLACRVIPVFTPEHRPASNAQVERYNGLWQEKVWKRYRFRTIGQLRARSQAFQKAYNSYLQRRLIRQGKSTLFKVRLRILPKGIRFVHPLPLCRGQIWFIRRVDENGGIQVFNETIRVPKRYAHEFVRVVTRTGPQTLSIYWKSSGNGRYKRIVHRMYKLREKAKTPML
jgi:hypothetical protein